MSTGPTPSFLELLRLRAGGHPRAGLDLSEAEGARRLALVDEILELLGDARAEPVSYKLWRAVRDIPKRIGVDRGRLSEFVAHLVPPDPGSVLAFRGGAAPAPVLFRAGEWEIDLSRTQRGAVLGQVLPVDPEAPDPDLQDGLGLLFGETRVFECELDPGGGFRFSRVDPGPYALVLEFAGNRIVVPEVDLHDGAT